MQDWGEPPPRPNQRDPRSSCRIRGYCAGGTQGRRRIAPRSRPHIARLKHPAMSRAYANSSQPEIIVFLAWKGSIDEWPLLIASSFQDVTGYEAEKLVDFNSWLLQSTSFSAS